MPGREEHERYMGRAIELASSRAAQFPFAAVLVDAGTGLVVAEGWNRSDENPVWHGEIDAINQGCLRHPGLDWGRLTLYSTAEPCPMCQSAILWAGIPSVVFGTSIRSLQALGWWQIDLSAEEVVRRATFRTCSLLGGVLEEECDRLFRSPPPRYTGKGE